MSLDLKRAHPQVFEFEDGKCFTEKEMNELYKKEKWMKLDYLCELLRDGNEEDAAEMIEYHFGNSHFFKDEVNKQTALLLTYKAFKDKNRLFNLITSVYTNDGYHFPRELIKIAKSIAKDIPESERFETPLDGELITVYRGSYTEPERISALRREYSWTTDYDTAMFFAYKTSWQMRDAGKEYPPAFLYRAVIPRNKIIAYMTCRDEAEVLQYENVRDITLLDAPTEAEVNAMFQRHRESIDKQRDEIKKEYGDEIKEKLINAGETN